MDSFIGNTNNYFINNQSAILLSLESSRLKNSIAENTTLYLQSSGLHPESVLNLTITKTILLNQSVNFFPLSAVLNELTLFVSNLSQVFQNIKVPNEDGIANLSLRNEYKLHYQIFTIYSLSNFNFDQIKAFNNYENNFNLEFQNDIKNEILKFQNLYEGISFILSYPFYDQISQLITYIDSLSFNIILLSLPLILLSFFITNYFLKSFEINSLKLARKYKNKGIKRIHLLWIYLFEFIPITVFAFILAIPFGIVIAIIGLVIQPFFVINTHNFPNVIINIPKIVNQLVFFGILYIILSYIPKVFTYITVNGSEHQSNIKESDPFWKKHYLDIWLILLSIAELSLASVFSFFFSSADLGVIQNLSVPFPLILVVGLLLYSSRAVPLLLNKLGTFSWTIGLNIFAIGSKELFSLKATFIRGLIMFTILTILFTS